MDPCFGFYFGDLLLLTQPMANFVTFGDYIFNRENWNHVSFNFYFIVLWLSLIFCIGFFFKLPNNCSKNETFLMVEKSEKWAWKEAERPAPRAATWVEPSPDL